MIATRGMRLLDVPMGELLSFAWSELYGNADEKGKRKLDLFARGRLGDDGGEIIEDENLPEALQGMEAPDWFTTDEDPLAEQWSMD